MKENIYGNILMVILTEVFDIQEKNATEYKYIYIVDTIPHLHIHSFPLFGNPFKTLQLGHYNNLAFLLVGFHVLMSLDDLV